MSFKTLLVRLLVPYWTLTSHTQHTEHVVTKAGYQDALKLKIRVHSLYLALLVRIVAILTLMLRRPSSSFVLPSIAVLC